MSTEQNVGFGALLGGGSAVLTNVLVRYFADDEITQPKDETTQPTRPFLYENAPLMGLIPGAVATFVAYKWMGGAPAAVACAITALFAATAPPIDDWIVDARAEKDAKAPADKVDEEGNVIQRGRYGGFAQRMANLGRKAA